MPSPFQRKYPPVRVDQKDAATATRDDSVFVCPYAGTVVAVNITFDVAMTGADTNSASESLINKGSTGAGTTVVATKAYTNGVNQAAFDEGTLTVSGTAANVTCAEGDVLALSRIKVGTGITNQPGMIQITYAAAD